MNIPEEFYKFCLGLHQDSVDLYGPGPQDWIKGALGFVQKERHAVLRDFLVDLLSGDYSDAQLNEIYFSTDAEVSIMGVRGVRSFLERLRDSIETRPPQ